MSKRIIITENEIRTEKLRRTVGYFSFGMPYIRENWHVVKREKITSMKDVEITFKTSEKRSYEP